MRSLSKTDVSPFRIWLSKQSEQNVGIHVHCQPTDFEDCTGSAVVVIWLMVECILGSEGRAS